LTRKHFEEALKYARKSVDATQLNKYELFRRKFDPVYAAAQTGTSSGININWPSAGGRQQQGATLFNRPQADDDDNLYN
jgi:hypothetical protein